MVYKSHILNGPIIKLYIMECILSHLQRVEIDTYMIDIAFWVTVVVGAQILVLVLSRNYIVMYKTIFVINIIIHMCLQHSNIL